jgi:SAM-dependent methyltransferase
VFSIVLASQGFHVRGSDLNELHLQKAIDDSLDRNLKVSFIKENMLNLAYDSEFDAVINMFYSFGFFNTDEENEKVLLNFYKALKPGGKFLMHTDVNVPCILSGKYKEHEERVLSDGTILKITDKYDPDTKRINGSWTMTDKLGEDERKYSVRVYTKEEFEALCKKVGFTSVVTYGGWNKEDYSEDSEDMMVVATK